MTSTKHTASIKEAAMSTRGHNIFDDLISDCERLAAAVRVAGNQPLNVARALQLGSAIDDMLDSLGKVSNARPNVGDQFDVEDRPAVERPDHVIDVRITMDEENVLAGLEEEGYFKQFSFLYQDKARAALASLDDQMFKAKHYTGEPWGTVGLADLVARAVQIAINGDDADWRTGAEA